MDFSKCQCEKPGFCNLYLKEMGESPPNWQWCQNATEAEREQHKIASDKGMKTTQHKNPRGNISTTEDLIQLSISKLFSKVIRNNNIAGIVGIPRSGMIPASAMAAKFSLPLYSFVDNKIILLNSFSEHGGYRMRHFQESDGKLLFVDDTCNTGRSAQKIKEVFPNSIMSAVYSTSKGSDYLDYYGEILENPHILSWNFFNSHHVKHSLFDLDGVLSPNIPLDICRDENKYVKFLQDVEPFYYRIPKLFEIQAIVTSRLEKYRDVTEDWLNRNQVKYKRLLMLPTEYKEAKWNDHIETASAFKSSKCIALRPRFFVESEIAEARAIKKKFPFTSIICPNHNIYF